MISWKMAVHEGRTRMRGADVGEHEELLLDIVRFSMQVRYAGTDVEWERYTYGVWG